MSTCTPRVPLPLTTPFSCPASCTATLVLTTYNATTTIRTSPPPGAPFSTAFAFESVYPTTDLSAYGIVAGFATFAPSSPTPGAGRSSFHDLACYPPRYAELRAAWFLDRDRGGECELPTYYSPGACPASWVPGGVRTVDGGAEVETAATCCPPAFTVRGGDDDLSVPAYCESVVGAATEAYAADEGKWTTVGPGWTVRAAGVEVRWREGDVGLLESAQAERVGGASVLSTGAKAGIGLGVGLGSLAVAAGAAGWFFRARRRRNNRARKTKGKMKEGDDGGGDDRDGPGRSEEEGFAGAGAAHAAGVGELEGEKHTSELPVEEGRVEMDGEGDRVAEMDAEGRQIRRAGAVRKDETKVAKAEETREDVPDVKEGVAELE